MSSADNLEKFNPETVTHHPESEASSNEPDQHRSATPPRESPPVHTGQTADIGLASPASPDQIGTVIEDPLGNLQLSLTGGPFGGSTSSFGTNEQRREEPAFPEPARENPPTPATNLDSLLTAASASPLPADSQSTQPLNAETENIEASSSMSPESPPLNTETSPKETSTNHMGHNYETRYKKKKLVVGRPSIDTSRLPAKAEKTRLGLKVKTTNNAETAQLSSDSDSESGVALDEPTLPNNHHVNEDDKGNTTQELATAGPIDHRDDLEDICSDNDNDGHDEEPLKDAETSHPEDDHTFGKAKADKEVTESPEALTTGNMGGVIKRCLLIVFLAIFVGSFAANATPDYTDQIRNRIVDPLVARIYLVLNGSSGIREETYAAEEKKMFLNETHQSESIQKTQPEPPKVIWGRIIEYFQRAKVSRRDAEDYEKKVSNRALYTTWNGKASFTSFERVDRKDLEDLFNDMAKAYRWDLDMTNRAKLSKWSKGDWERKFLELKMNQSDVNRLTYGMLGMTKWADSEDYAIAYMDYGIEFEFAPEVTEKEIVSDEWYHVGPWRKVTTIEVETKPYIQGETVDRLTNFFRFKALKAFQYEGFITGPINDDHDLSEVPSHLDEEDVK